MSDGYVDEIEDDTRPEERELSEDAQWKKIQKNTFTRWTNQHLKVSGLQITDLQTDLSDGLKLVSLIQVLASHQFKQINKRPTFRTQKLENVTKVLKFLEENEQLRIVNIDSSDIVDSRLKLILGLIWTLILHFSISMPLWEGEEPIAKDAKGKGPSPKHRILSWINTKMPDKPVKNLTTDWNNGTAIGALVDALAPGLCPDWTDWDPKDALKNAKEAMDLAEKWLDIAQLLKPEELVDPRLDEKAMMTYLSQFPRAKVKEGAPLRPKTNPARVRAYGPGLERTGNAVKAPARFVVDTFSAGAGKLDVLVLNPKGSQEPCAVEVKENQNQAYACFYTPTMEGEYRVIIKYASKEITNSPFQVLVEGAAGDPKKVTASGPGIEKTGNVMGRRTFFNVLLNGAGNGNIECKIKDPHGREEIVKPLITKQTEEEYLVEYTPILGGQHSVSVLFAGTSIPLSPFPVEVSADSGKRTGEVIMPKSAGQSNAAPAPVATEPQTKTSVDGISMKPGAANPGAAYVTGRGVQSKGLRVNEPTEFTVHTEKAGPGKVVAKIVGPGGVNENVRITSTTEVTHVCYYTPTKIGQYVIVVEYGQGQVQKSPFKVDIAGTNPSKVIAYGPGLKSGVVNVPAPFTVETHGSPGELGFAVEGASEAKITCANNGDGSAAVQYLPTLPGEYAVHVLCNKEDIKGSPFMAQITEAPKSVPDVSKVKAYGPGLELNGVEVNKETNFIVETKTVGVVAEVKCWGWDSNGVEIPIKALPKGDGVYYCTYTSKFIGKISVYISYGGIELPSSPYKVNVSGGQESGAVTAYGPGLQTAVIGRPATFTVDTKNAGNNTGPIAIDIVAADGKKIPFQSRDKDGLREVQYTATGTVQTTYTINISYKNQAIKNSPFKVNVSTTDKNVTTGQAYASGRGIQPKGIRVNEEVEFVIHTEKTGIESTPKVKVIGPGGVQETVKVTKISTATFQCNYKPSKIGNYIVTADYGTSSVMNSPFKVDVAPVKVTKINAYGPGLERATVDVPATFIVETNGESSSLGFAINGPSEAKMQCTDNGDGSVTVSYLPTLSGEYAVHVLSNDEDIPKSPFMVMATQDSLPKIDGSKVKVFGPGVQPQGVVNGKTTSFTVDIKAFKERKGIEVLCMNQEGSKIPVQVTDKLDGTFTCTYTPTKPVKHTIYVAYCNVPSGQSPYKVDVSQGQSGTVKVSGPGIEKATIAQPTFFTIDTTEVGSQTTSLSIDLRSNKGQQVPFSSKIVKPGISEVTYTPSDKEISEITVTINYGSEPVNNSPFKVEVSGGSKGLIAGAVTVSGKGVLPTGVKATEPVTFRVHTSSPTPKDTLKTRVIGPGGVPVNVQTKKISNELYECQYTAPKEGTYIINVDMNNKPAEKSPFKIEVSPFKDSKIKAYGPGLEGGVAGVKAPFIVNPNGSTSELGFKIDGPSEAVISCKDNGDGTVGVDYLPKEKGEYVVHVLADNEEIPRSPYVVDIGPSTDSTIYPEKVKAYGPGLQTPGVISQKPTQFTVDCSQAGAERPLAIKCYDTDGTDLPITLSSSVKMVSQCQYTPKKKGKHMISVLYGGAPIANSPFTVNASSGDVASLVTAYGPGLQSAPVNIPISFTIDATKASGPITDVKHAITDDKGRPIPTKATEHTPGKQDICYTVPETVQAVTVNVSHQGKPINGSPFQVPVTTAAPRGLVTVTGKGVLPSGVQATETVTFKVRNDAPTPKDTLKTKIIGPAGVPVNVQTKKISNELYECQYTAPKQGLYILSVDMNNKPAEKSPFKIDVTPFKDSKIKAYGPGLEGGVAGAKAPFIVNTNGSPSELGFKIEGPSEATISCKDNGDGTVGVEYLPKDKGEYVVHVLADKEEIPRSPFVVDIGPSPDNTSHPEKVKAYGPGLVTPGVAPQKPTQFTVDSSEAGTEKPLLVKCYDDQGTNVPVNLSAPVNRVTQCQYTPTKNGKHTISVTYDGVEVPNSPFDVVIHGGEAPSPVVAYGPGLQSAPSKIPTSFIIDATKALGPMSDVKHSISDDKGRPISSKATETSPRKQEISYTVPEDIGSVAVNVTHQGQPIGGSPFHVPVISVLENNVIASGRGLAPTGLRIGEEVNFVVKSDKGVTTDNVKSKVIGPGGVQEVVNREQITPTKCLCTYTPSKIGPYSIIAEAEGTPVVNSPFKVDIAGPVTSPVRAFGSGLEHGEACKPATFIVETNDHAGSIEFKINGPGEAKITCENADNGQINVHYTPELPGEYVVRVLSDQSDIKNSPFYVDVAPSTSAPLDVSKVKIFGPGIEQKGVQSNKPTNFSVDTRACGTEPIVEAQCYNKDGKKVPVTHKKDSYGIDNFEYSPKEKGSHTVQVHVNSNEVTNSPFHIDVDTSIDNVVYPEDLDFVLVYGPGLQTADTASSTPSRFYIDCRNCDSPIARIPTMEVLDDKKVPVPSRVKETDTPKLYEASYEPSKSPLSGKFYPSVKIDGSSVPNIPHCIDAPNKKLDENVPGNVQRLEKNVQVNEPQRFQVKLRDGTQSKPEVLITDSCGVACKPAKVIKVQPDLYDVTYTPENVETLVVDVKIDDKSLMGTPANVSVVHNPIDTKQIKIEGLAPIVQAGKLQSFDVINSEQSPLKPDILDSKVVSPSNVCVPVQKTAIPQGVRVSYNPTETGPHTVGCWVQDQPVAETPCIVKTVPKRDLVKLDRAVPSNATMSNPKEGQLNEPCSFVVNTADQTKREDVDVKVMSPSNQQTIPVTVQEVPSGLLCEFVPTSTGPHTVMASVGNIPVKSSPSIIQVKDAQQMNETAMRTGNPVNQGTLSQPMEENIIKPQFVSPVKGSPMEGNPSNPSHHPNPSQTNPGNKPYTALEEAIKELKDQSIQDSKWPQSKLDQPSARVKAYGEGLQKATATEKAIFTIDSKDAPTAPLGVTVEGPGEAEIKCIDNGDGTCGVEYEAPIPGLYTVNVLYDNIHIPKSPFITVVYPKDRKDLDLSQVTATGPGLNPEGIFKDCFARFTVDASKIDSRGDGTVKTMVQTPSGKKTLGTVDNLKNGHYDVRYSPTEEGPHRISVLYEGLPIMSSPFIVPSKPGFNARLVTAKGPGLDTCKVNQSTQFTVDLDGAGHGSLGLSIEGPADAHIECHDNKDGTCAVVYTPIKAGEYDINVKFNDEDISDSPFRVKVLDEVKPQNVKCDGPKTNSKQNVPNRFIVDASEAGEAPLKVTVEQPDQKVPTKSAIVKPIDGAEPGLYNVDFVPEALGPCLVHVKYDEKSIRGSPFKTTVIKPADINKVNISGEGVCPANGTILASMPAVFYVDTTDAGVSPDVNVGLFSPNGEPMPLRIESTPNGMFTCEYQTHDAGDHKINVDVDGQTLPKSPFTVKSVPTGNAEKCQIKDGKKNVIQVNKESIITVETKEAGKGQITCTVKKIQRQRVGQVEQITVLKSLMVRVEEHQDGFTSVHYTPKDKGEYLVELKFGGNPVPNGKFTQIATYEETIDTVTRLQSRRESVKVASTAFHGVDFNIINRNMKLEDLEALVVRPSGKIEPVKLGPSDEGDEKIRVVYQPTERGVHQLQITHQDRPIPGSPFQFFVDTKGEGRVSAYGPGLSSGKTNEVAEFIIVTKDAGQGGLSLVVEGPSKTEIKCEDRHDGTFKVSYVPQVPGDYRIIIKFKDQEIAGSPFIAKITGERVKKSQVAVGNSSDIPLEITVKDISTLTAELTTPSKKQLPCVIKKMDNGSLGVSFSPKEVGEHWVNIYEKGVNIVGSPFKIDVKKDEVGDASKVKVHGQGLETGQSNEINEFTIDTRESGYGSLNISIEGPSKAEIDCKEADDGTCRVKYVPTQPGDYVINVKYAGKDVRGSPFNVKVAGEKPLPSEREVMEHTQEAARTTTIGGSCEINLKTDDIPVKDLTAAVHTPSGFTEPCGIEDAGNGNLKLKFVARESGVHYVSVLHKERHITGSPFQFTVGSVESGGSHKVTASGPGLERGLLDIANEFTIYTREAGAGNLSLAMEGPSKPRMEFQESQDKGSCAVKYYVSRPGEYELSIKFNNEHIASSPFMVQVTDESIQSMQKKKNVSSSFDGNTVKETGGLVSFTVRTVEGQVAQLEATVQTPSGNTEPAVIQQVGDNQYGIKFTPTEAGVHLVHVEDNKKPIHGSPFRIQVGEYKADPGMVVATGEGLSRALVNEKAHFFVNTANAGSGSLNVAIDGPSKVTLNCHETDEGYEFTYVATAPGDYLINITFGGNFHIVGSPFKARVEGIETVKQERTGEQHSQVEIETSEKKCVSQYSEKTSSNAEKVVCQGLGLKQGHLNVVNSFFVDGSQAGYDMLLVGVCGPVRPCEEIVVKHVGNNQFTVDYVVREPGLHVLMVKWGDRDVPGSPFLVHVD